MGGWVLPSDVAAPHRGQAGSSSSTLHLAHIQRSLPHSQAPQPQSYYPRQMLTTTVQMRS